MDAAVATNGAAAVTIKDSRENLNKMKDWRNQATAEVLKQKVTSAVLNVLPYLKTACYIAGGIATVVAGVVATPAASPIVAKASFAVAGALDGVSTLLNSETKEEQSQGVEQIKAAVVNLQSEIKDVSIADKDIIKMKKAEEKNDNRI